VSDAIRVEIGADSDMVAARAAAKHLAAELGFSATDATLIATAVSEIARNIVVHAGRGAITMTPRRETLRYGIVIVATDSGPGIRNLDAALEHGYAGRGGLGLGLPGARRLMDEFDIDSNPSSGTLVTMTKWRPRDELERLRERT
jgi:serine/threonine-protein kinase RsbT